MKRILLACSSGMSTSLLVSKMEQAAKEQGIEAKIWAVAQDKAPEDMKQADVLLIGPQMRFMKKKFSVVAEELGIPLDVIDPVSYGRIDGKAVFNHALALIEKG
ncbi:PTS sugar transporter subunit IIB [Amphibacillus xylanus]|uniref:PTS system beta-glucoside-specific enzyme IIB component n=1 Tax=Amphibacillus xylanus (strain ATCC 51415 / DSM 6626 / JCM 7361 / LMG 17667 / NBRC 15112 / Ep01) TaxID=698758 RepID=K0J812_AMPXN|nr:PTS sugar transporter subunit IIB [Amphibacillus xylanus]BAM48313.1 PTS system beta-glucoside-specific enzyme IIB component [Amphibacillus xylanus NBRC 15112]